MCAVVYKEQSLKYYSVYYFKHQSEVSNIA